VTFDAIRMTVTGPSNLRTASQLGQIGFTAAVAGAPEVDGKTAAIPFALSTGMLCLFAGRRRRPSTSPLG